MRTRVDARRCDAAPTQKGKLNERRAASCWRFALKSTNQIRESFESFLRAPTLVEFKLRMQENS